MVIIALSCFDDLHLQACLQIKPSILAARDVSPSRKERQLYTQASWRSSGESTANAIVSQSVQNFLLNSIC